MNKLRRRIWINIESESFETYSSNLLYRIIIYIALNIEWYMKHLSIKSLSKNNRNKLRRHPEQFLIRLNERQTIPLSRFQKPTITHKHSLDAVLGAPPRNFPPQFSTIISPISSQYPKRQTSARSPQYRLVIPAKDARKRPAALIPRGVSSSLIR